MLAYDFSDLQFGYSFDASDDLEDIINGFLHSKEIKRGIEPLSLGQPNGIVHAFHNKEKKRKKRGMRAHMYR